MKNSSPFQFNNPQIAIYGYCEKTPFEIREIIRQRTIDSLVELPGQFILVIEENNNLFIVSSAYGVVPYFYLHKGDKFYHSDTVTRVIKESSVSPKYNWSALADLMVLGHVLENETLHPDISRVAPASIYHYDGHKLSVTTKTWEDLHGDHVSSPELALNAFNNEIEKWLTKDSIVSISGGFDSRTILSGFLKLGEKPLLLSMGFDDSIDVIISKEISRLFNLDLVQVSLDVKDYLYHGSEISRITNGTALTTNWHTYIYTKKPALDGNRNFFVGANGEFARSFFHDQGILAYIAGIYSPWSVAEIWKMKLYGSKMFDVGEINGLCKELGVLLSPENNYLRIKRLCKLCHNRVIRGFDRFYLEQRVKNAIGDGMKMYAANLSWKAPFLSREWVNTVWNMKQNMKFGSNWHRYAIHKNCPQLLGIQEEKTSRPMKRTAEILYWMPFRKKLNRRLYSDYPLWFSTEVVREFINDNIGRIDAIINREVVDKVMAEHRVRKNRTSAISFIIASIFWDMNLESAR